MEFYLPAAKGSIRVSFVRFNFYFYGDSNFDRGGNFLRSSKFFGTGLLKKKMEVFSWKDGGVIFWNRDSPGVSKNWGYAEGSRNCIMQETKGSWNLESS
jgi:hypothetical protein